MSCKLVVIGGGPGGYVTGIRAAQLGMEVIILEDSRLGGICLNWGCIPTKALLKSAETYDLIQHADDFGIKVKDITYDFDAIIKRSRNVSEKLSSGIEYLMQKHNIKVIKGKGRIVSKGKVEIDGKTIITADEIIIATGARPKTLPGIEIDGKFVWGYREAMIPKSLPKNIAIIGSGAIGIEFASFYRSLGANVLVLEVMDKIMPNEDHEISALAQKLLEKRGMEIMTSTMVKKITKNKNSVSINMETKNKKTLTREVDVIISAVGVQGNTEDIGLEKVGVQVERNTILINEWGKTNVDGIWAIGDVAGAPCLAHKASHEGIICVEKIAEKYGKKFAHPLRPLDKKNIPGCTYCTPQIASVGLTEEAAKIQGYDIKVGRFYGKGNGKAVACGHTDSMVKVIFDKKTGELLGAHMLGDEVTEMIQGYVIGKTLEATDVDFHKIIWPHPTVSEMMHEAVLDADDEALHG